MNRLSLQEREQIAKKYGYNSWNLAQSDIITAINDTDSWSNVVTDVKEVTEGVKEDVQPSILTEGDVVGDTGVVTTPEGDTYTPTDDGQGYTFTPSPDQTSASPAQTTEGGVSYGRGRGGTKEKQQEMKKQATVQPSGIKEDKPGGGEFSYSPPKKDKYERPGTSGAPGHHW